MTDTEDNQRALDTSFENEGMNRSTVTITLKEYDKLREQQKYITDRDLREDNRTTPTEVEGRHGERQVHERRGGSSLRTGGQDSNKQRRRRQGEQMTDSEEKQRALDASMENESQESRENYGPMVQISLKEYDKLKERSKYITDRDMISVIDKIEELVRALRKHIVRLDIE